jgi:hypothetical protein
MKRITKSQKPAPKQIHDLDKVRGGTTNPYTTIIFH